MTPPPFFTVNAALAGQRLDKALAALLPELGLRARRRLWEAGEVLVNGKPCPPGHAVKLGDAVEVRAGATTSVSGAAPASVSAGGVCPCAFPGNDAPRFLEAHEGLLFFHKPAGLHSARLPEGRGGLSLEDCLASLLPPALHQGSPVLLNRLDCGTSGLVLAASHAEAAQRWHEDEDTGVCRKTYVALLRGTLEAAVLTARTLDTHHRRVTRVMGSDAASPLRHTLFRPVAHVRAAELTALAPWAPSLTVCPADQPLTLALACIRKGARHQIRAHAAHAGFPLWGDGRYAGAPPDGVENFILHHAMLQIRDRVVVAPCPWLSLLDKKIANNITQSLKSNIFLS